MFSLIPLPYRILAVVVIGLGLYMTGYVRGKMLADQSAEVDRLRTTEAAIKMDLANAKQTIAEQDKVISDLNAVEKAVTDRADAAERGNLALESQLHAYVASLKNKPACTLSSADISGLRAIGTGRSQSRPHRVPSKGSASPAAN